MMVWGRMSARGTDVLPPTTPSVLGNIYQVYFEQTTTPASDPPWSRGPWGGFETSKGGLTKKIGLSFFCSPIFEKMDPRLRCPPASQIVTPTVIIPPIKASPRASVTETYGIR